MSGIRNGILDDRDLPLGNNRVGVDIDIADSTGCARIKIDNHLW